MMSNHDLVIHDSRYSAPVWRQVAIAEEGQVRVIAQRVLAESSHHLGVEVFQGGARLFGIGSVAKPGRMPTRSDTLRHRPLAPSAPDPNNA
jgi:hypothetical protein